MIWWLLIPVLLLLCLAAWLLFAPFYLEIDSRRGWARLRYAQLATAALQVEGSTLMLVLDMPFLHKRIDLVERVLQPQKPKHEKQVKKELKQKEKSKKSAFSFRTITAAIKTFRVQELYIDIDTGDMQLNGLLYAPVHMLGVYAGRHLRINFNGRTVVVLQIKNSTARVLWAFLRNRFLTFNNKKNERKH